MASASLMGQVGGGLMSAAGSYYSAKSQKIALESQAAIADINARVSEMGAQSALYQGQQQVGALTLKAGQLKSSQRAAQAAGGIDIGSGSAAEVRASTDIMKEIDANTINANAVRSAWGYRIQGTNYQNQALMARANASAINPASAAATSLLGSAGKVASSWYAFSKSGAFAVPTQAAAPVEDRSFSAWDDALSAWDS
jgi:hypothetical protein